MLQCREPAFWLHAAYATEGRKSSKTAAVFFGLKFMYAQSRYTQEKGKGGKWTSDYFSCD